MLPASTLPIPMCPLPQHQELAGTGRYPCLPQDGAGKRKVQEPSVGAPGCCADGGARQAQEQPRCRQRGGTAVTAGAGLGTATAGEGTAGPRRARQAGLRQKRGSLSPRLPLLGGGMGTAPTTLQSSEEQVPALSGQSKTPASMPRDS